MFEIRDRMIRLSRGDTGMIAFDVDGVTLTEKDRAVFTVARGSTRVMQKVIAPEGSRFCVAMTNDETDGLRAGMYEWDLRIVLEAKIDSEGVVRDGREVITPWPPGRLEVVKVVGEV